MPLVPAKCPDCGGLVEVDNEKRAGLCQHCGNPFVVEDAIQTFNTYYNITNNYNTTNVTNNNTSIGEGAVVNIYEDKTKDFVIEGGVLKKYQGESVDVVIPDTVVEIAGECFKGLKIKSVIIPNSVTNIGISSFELCKNLSSITFSDSLTDIEASSFNGCTNLTSVILPNSVTKIGDMAFYGCKMLNSITIPESIKSIGWSVFDGCENLVSVSLPDSLKNRESNIFNNTPYYKNKLAKLEADKKQKALELNSGLKYSNLSRMSKTIATGYYHSVALKNDGTVIGTKYIPRGTLDSHKGQFDFGNWTDIIAISASEWTTVGLRIDGTVVAVGANHNGQSNVKTWTDIVAISAGASHTVALKKDGTVVSTEYIGDKEYYYGQCSVENWTDIVAISAGGSHTVGLKKDGTVVATKYKGKYYKGQCDVSDWSDIIEVSAGASHTVGLCLDGTVVAVGNNERGQCNVDDWTDIVAISAGSSHTVGLKSDGTVVATKFLASPDSYSKLYSGQCEVSSWRDIVQISCYALHTIGLKKDGSVIAAGENLFGRCNVGGFTNIDKGLNVETAQEYEEWKTEKTNYFNKIAEDRQRKAEEERRIAEQQAQYRSQGLCQHCGGEFKGLFGKKCVKCGKPKDY